MDTNKECIHGVPLEWNCNACSDECHPNRIMPDTPDSEPEMRTELVGYDEIGSAIRKVKDEPLFTIEQFVTKLMECEDLKIWTPKLFWSASPEEVINLLTASKG